MKDEINKENLHKGHRKRVKERFLQDGLEHFSPHEILELILFYALPQRDTNELGHRLIAHFGSLSAVFAAPFYDLCEVDGLGEHGATLLKLWLPVASCLLSEEISSNHALTTLDRLGHFCINRCVGDDVETVYLLLLDNALNLSRCLRICSGSINSASFTSRKVIELAMLNRAANVVLLHNHPHGIAVPSMQDVTATLELQQAFSAVGISLLEHIVVSGRQYSPVLLNTRMELPSTQDPVLKAFYNSHTAEGER